MMNFGSDLRTGVIIACFQAEGMASSLIDLFIKIARGVAIISALSFRSRGGTFARPVDLFVFKVFNSLAMNDSLISDNLKMLLLGLGLFEPQVSVT